MIARLCCVSVIGLCYMLCILQHVLCLFRIDRTKQVEQESRAIAGKRCC